MNFVTGNLRPVKSDVDQELSSWYRSHSRVYVANDHACWEDPVFARKVTKRRFGAVERSPYVGLNRMMKEHAEDAQQWILSLVPEGQGDTTEEEGTS